MRIKVNGQMLGAPPPPPTSGNGSGQAAPY
jgi:hypothetical protein